jgi:hypothetical protein
MHAIGDTHSDQEQSRKLSLQKRKQGKKATMALLKEVSPSKVARVNESQVGDPPHIHGICRCDTVDVN